MQNDSKISYANTTLDNFVHEGHYFTIIIEFNYI